MTAVAAKHKFTYRSRAKFWVHLVLVIGSILMIFPFIWTILTSFKTQGEAIMIPPIIFPSHWNFCLLYTSPSPRDGATSRMPSSA